MDELEAREILKPFILDDNSLYAVSERTLTLKWEPSDPNYIILTGAFTINYLKTIMWWVDNMARKD